MISAPVAARSAIADWYSGISVSALGGGGRASETRRAAMYSNSKRPTRKPKWARASAESFIAAESIAPPAPWANKMVTRASFGPRIKKFVDIDHRSLMEGTARMQNTSHRQTLFG